MISPVRVIPSESEESKGVQRPNNSVRPLEKGSNSERIGSRNRTVYLETNWEIAQFRVSPVPDQSPASEVRLRKSGFGSPVSLE